MDIQIHSSINLFLQTPANAEKVWEHSIEEPFKPLYEVIPMSFSQMGAATPENSNAEIVEMAKRLFEADIPNRVRQAICHAYQTLQEHGITQFPKVLHVAVLVSSGENYVHNKLNHGFTGFGGIPGFIILILSPSDYVIERIEAHVAHEFHHNVRFLIEPWPVDRNITVGKLLLDEGMAECFAATLYGEEKIGMQTTSLVHDRLVKARKLIEPYVFEVGFTIAAGYLYGDDISEIYSTPKTGLPHGAGYAVGYTWVKKYLKKTGSDIFALTKVPSNEILSQLFLSARL